MNPQEEFWAANEAALRLENSWDRYRNEHEDDNDDEEEDEASASAEIRRAKKRSYAPPKKGNEEIPEILIVAGIYITRLMLWYLFRLADHQGVDVSDV